MTRNGRLAPAYRRRMVIFVSLSLLPMAAVAGAIIIKLLEKLS